MTTPYFYRWSYRHSDTQFLGVRLIWVDANTHGQALDNLGEVARSVVRRDGRIADATGGPQAFHGPLQYGTRQGVHLDVHRLPWLHTRQLRFAEVGRDVNRVERDHRHQWLAGIHECADAHRLLTDHAVDGRRDLGIGELQLRSGLRRLRLGKCSLGLFKIGFQDVRLLSRRLQARAVLVAAGQPNGQLRLGLLLCLDRA